MKKVVFVNPRGGRAKKPGELEKLTKILQQLPDVEIKLLNEQENPTLLAKQAVRDGAAVIGAAGGDGTLNSIASGLVGSNVPFVPLPFGTLNHFARDVGIPTDLEKAAQLMVAGSEQTIDMGQVNDRYFLNNSSLGIYPRLVSLRERREKELGKWRAYLWALRVAMRNQANLHVRLKAVEGVPDRSLEVGLIFVANNACDVWLPQPGRRPCLNDNLLDVYIVEAHNRLKLFSLAWHYLLNHLDNSPDVIHSSQTEFVIQSGSRSVSVARDGEVNYMTMPLTYKSVKNALCVRIPEATA